ncbi:MAG TPA: hypothetical protein VG028_21740, partial [Terriglobia bacterium]|nr:hypothetical protein [Terriglobia bacterium]
MTKPSSSVHVSPARSIRRKYTLPFRDSKVIASVPSRFGSSVWSTPAGTSDGAWQRLGQAWALMRPNFAGRISGSADTMTM